MPKLPPGFSPTELIKVVQSITEAEALGIVNTHADETKATGGNIKITNTGAVGEIVKAYIKPAGMDKILLGTYVISSGDTKESIAKGLEAAINLNKLNHKINDTVYSFEAMASVIDGTDWKFTLTAPAKLGKSINDLSNTVLTVEVKTPSGATGTLTSTIVQFSGGSGSQIAVLYYHVSEFFRLCPEGKLYIGLYDSTLSDSNKWASARLKTMQDFAEGDIKRFGMYTYNAVGTAAASLVSTISANETVFATLFDEKRYAQTILTMDNYASPIALNTFPDLRASDSKYTTADLGNSGSGEGFRLLGVWGRTIGTTGEWLGIRSNIAVNESVGSYQLGRLDGNSEFLKCAFSNGQLYKTVYASSTNLIKQLENYGYLFPKNYDSDPKAFFNTDQNCASATGDYYQTKTMETWNKAARLINLAITPIVESQVFINTSTGEIALQSRVNISSKVFAVLTEMARVGEISTDSEGKIPPESVAVNKYLVNDEVKITATIIETRTLKKITVTIGFAKSI
jgi:hypothetical protein